MQYQTNSKALRTAIPYIREYKGRVFVVKIGGNLCEPGRVLDHLIDQINLLYQLGIRIVIVHGGGPQADALGKRLGVEPRAVDGRRITDDATLEVVKMAFAGTVNTDVVAAFRKARVPAVGLSGIDGQLLTAVRRPPRQTRDSRDVAREVDFGHVGDLVRVDTGLLTHLLDGGNVPVICSLAADEAGNVLNINADTIAAEVAITLRAAKYFLITDVDGLMRDRRDPATLESFLDLEQLDTLRNQGVL